jgi:hypothetical protein
MFSHKAEDINTMNHPWVGVIWPIKGSKDNTYSVEMTNHGFSCDCIAYAKCKHIKEVESKFEDVDTST